MPVPTTEIADLTRSFTRSLKAANRSDNTIKIYAASIRYFETFLCSKALPEAIGCVRREHIEGFLTGVLAARAPATAAAYFRSLQQFFRWLVEEGELPVSPMVRMKPPQIPETPPPVLQTADLQRLIKACEGREFADRRDLALLYLLFDTGMRRAEIAGLRVVDLDLDLQTASVLGKGRRPRSCPFGRKAAQVLDRYLRARAQHEDRDLPWLWLGRSGRLTDWGIAQAIERRAAVAGVDHANLHRFRHTFAHSVLLSGMQEQDLMQLAGWKSRQMIGRYGASAAGERARAAFRQHSPADGL